MLLTPTILICSRISCWAPRPMASMVITARHPENNPKGSQNATHLVCHDRLNGNQDIVKISSHVLSLASFIPELPGGSLEIGALALFGSSAPVSLLLALLLCFSAFNLLHQLKTGIFKGFRIIRAGRGKASHPFSVPYSTMMLFSLDSPSTTICFLPCLVYNKGQAVIGMNCLQGNKEHTIQYLGNHLVAGGHGGPEDGVTLIQFNSHLKYLGIGIGQLLTNIGHLDHFPGKLLFREMHPPRSLPAVPFSTC